ncbi:hypothetical protein [Labrenzia sp. VG12]|uniref:hypothetical protein n=1 Tax=Labrenzia sp. VG12 TaxID=2021862 RepID=UPI0012FDF801|nr:hypothetical protein [Labrenzia sp. VG12]
MSRSRKPFGLLSVALSLGAFRILAPIANAEGRLGRIEDRPIESSDLRGELEANSLSRDLERPIAGDLAADGPEGVSDDRIDRGEIDRKLGKEDIHACKDGVFCSPF